MVNTVIKSAYGPILATTITKGDIVLNAADKAGHRITRIYGYNTTKDHNNKRCIDFMHYGDTAMRDWLVNYLKTNAKFLGVCGIISNRRVMGFPSNGDSYRGPEGEWRNYMTKPGLNPHTDHVHVEFNATPAVNPPAKDDNPKPKPKPKPPAKYPTPSATCAVYLDKLRPGETNSDSVYRWRQAMNAISFVGGRELPLTGDYDSALVAETKKFQDQKCHDKQDGWPGPKQAQYGFELAEKEMKRNGVRSLVIYKDSSIGITDRNRVVKVW